MNILHKERESMFNNRKSVPVFERLIASASYISFGLVGFIWVVFAHLSKSRIEPYLRYHVFQSIFLSIFYYIISLILGLIMQILSVIPLINQLSNRIYYWLNTPMILGFSIINTCIYAVIIYLVVTCLAGKLSYIPWVSDIIKETIKR